MLVNYLVSYMTIIGITFVETLIVFLVFKVKYAIILTIICACFDILPILGIGAIYIPLALLYFFLFKSYSCSISYFSSAATFASRRAYFSSSLNLAFRNT